MTEPRPDQAPIRTGVIPREFLWILLLTVTLVLGLFVASNWHHAIHKNDPLAFAERSRPLLEGSLPYVDYEFEHLPLAIAPMAAAAVIEELGPDIHYTLIFWTIMVGVLFGVGHLTNRLGDHLGIKNAALRWIAISWALLPLLAFRVDALSVLLALLAVVLSIEERQRASAWAMAAAIAAKGWPVVLVVVDWWRGRRRRAALTVVATMAGVAALSTFPLFRAGREFFGVHIETATGSAVVLIRLLRGLPTQTGVAAGASYVEVGSWAMAVNLAVGATIGILGLRVLTRGFTWDKAVGLIGVLAIAIMLISPLLSAQFMIWFTPFAAVSTSRRVRLGAAGTTLLTGIFVTFWFFDSSWWWAVIVARNGFLIWTGWAWAQHLMTDRPSLRQDIQPEAAPV